MATGKVNSLNFKQESEMHILMTTPRGNIVALESIFLCKIRFMKKNCLHIGCKRSTNKYVEPNHIAYHSRHKQWRRQGLLGARINHS